MKKFLKYFLGFIVILVLGAAIAWFGFLKPEPPAISDIDRAKVTLIPLPSELTIGKDRFIIDNELGFTLNDASSDKIDKALNRFYTKLGKSMGTELSKTNGNSLEIIVGKINQKYPTLLDDASYQLNITDSKITLTANSDTGVLYGLETLLQLVSFENYNWGFNEMELNDKPRYPWRGIMIDVGRHWIPKEVIKRNIDAMTSVKMNVLHLHLTEYQGFRIESKKFPKLHELGSNGNYFSQNDIKEILDYAAERAIRVVPEFDIPGHSTSWLVGYPELGSSPGPYVLDSIFGVLHPVIDPSKESTYSFLDEFIEEMATLFPDEYIHIGGDEVETTHWKESVAITDYMSKNKLKDYHELQANFNIRIQKILKKHGKKMMGWDEIIHPDLPKEGIAVQSWRSQKSLWDAVKLGNKAVLSNGYYLDYKQAAGKHYKIDPLIIPSAVTIDIDEGNWKAWNVKMYAQGTEISGNLYLFGEGENLRGVMNFMETSTSFDQAKLENGELTFSMETSFGKMDYNLNMSKDSLKGFSKIAIFDVEFKGEKTGGSDMPDGIVLPKFEKIDPLTPEQETLIMGGEACMWTEMANHITLESRIWPRAAAVAEKLWSPQALTTNVDDMYRRLMVFDKNLEQLTGLKHKSNQEALLRKMVPEQYLDPLITLASVLEEDKFFNRMSMYKPALYTFTPLDRMVDAVFPESFVAYSFNKDVSLFLETGNIDVKKRLQKQLKTWSENHSKLLPVFNKVENFSDDDNQGNEKAVVELKKKMEHLKEIVPHSIHLSELSKLALESLNGNAELNKNIDSLLINANKAYGGTLLPITDGISKLLIPQK